MSRASGATGAAETRSTARPSPSRSVGGAARRTGRGGRDRRGRGEARPPPLRRDAVGASHGLCVVADGGADGRRTGANGSTARSASASRAAPVPSACQGARRGGGGASGSGMTTVVCGDAPGSVRAGGSDGASRRSASAKAAGLGVPRLGVLGEGAFQHLPQRARRDAVQLGRAVQNLVHHGGNVGGLEGLAARQRLGHGDGERKHVAAPVQQPPIDLLRGHIGGRADHRARLRQPVVGEDVGDAEVHKFRRAVGADEHVVGLDVAVNDAAPVRVLQRVGDLGGHRQRLSGGHRAEALEAGAQRLALQMLHGDELPPVLGVSHLVDGDDGRVGEGGDGPRFPLEPPGQVLPPCRAEALPEGEDLERDPAAPQGVGRLIDDAAEAPAQFPAQQVPPQALRRRGLREGQVGLCHKNVSLRFRQTTRRPGGFPLSARSWAIIAQGVTYWAGAGHLGRALWAVLLEFTPVFRTGYSTALPPWFTTLLPLPAPFLRG